MCYFPRNCFIFYNNRNEIIGFYEVCLECGRMISIPECKVSLKGGLSGIGLKEFERFCTSAGITVQKDEP
jgi:hypothetical protein